MREYIPLRVKVMEQMQRHPAGMSCAELEAILGISRVNISSVLSKMFMYGGPVEKCGPKTFGPGMRWRLRPTSGASAHGPENGSPVRPA